MLFLLSNISNLVDCVGPNNFEGVVDGVVDEHNIIDGGIVGVVEGQQAGLAFLLPGEVSRGILGKIDQSHNALFSLYA